MNVAPGTFMRLCVNEARYARWCLVLLCACAGGPTDDEEPVEQPDEEPGGEHMVDDEAAQCPAELPAAGFCLRRRDGAAPAPPFVRARVDSVEPDLGRTCWSYTNARAGGVLPDRTLRVSLTDADNVGWILVFDADLGFGDASLVGEEIELNLSTESASYWMRQSLRVDDADGLRVALGCAPEGVSMVPATGPGCVVDRDCGPLRYGPARVQVDGIEVDVAPGEVVEREGYAVAARKGILDLSGCTGSRDGPGEDCFARIVRVAR